MSDPVGVAVVDLSRWLAVRWLADRRRPPGPVPLLEYSVLGRDRSGAGTRIALLAGHPDLRHPDLRGARVTTRPAGRGRASHEHTAGGTALASLLVGQGAAHVRGLVPEAQLLVAPVHDVDGACADQRIVSAVRWSLDAGAQVLVLPFVRVRPARRVAVTLRAAAEGGTRVFVAAETAGSHTLTFPASVSGVAAVTGHDRAAMLPSSSHLAHLAAPGRDVPAAGPDGPVRLTGSAPAAVLAAGAWAGLLGRPDALPDASAAWAGEPGVPEVPYVPDRAQGRPRREARDRDHLVDA